MIWLNIGLSWKIRKIPIDPVLVSHPNRHWISYNGCFVFTVCLVVRRESSRCNERSTLLGKKGNVQEFITGGLPWGWCWLAHMAVRRPGPTVLSKKGLPALLRWEIPQKRREAPWSASKHCRALLISTRAALKDSRKLGVVSLGAAQDCSWTSHDYFNKPLMQRQVPLRQRTAFSQVDLEVGADLDHRVFFLKDLRVVTT